MKEYYDEETNIVTRYDFWIKEVKFNYRWCPGATVSLYRRSTWVSDGSQLLYMKLDCPKESLWTPHTPVYFGGGVEIRYWADGYIRQEMLSTEQEVDEIARRAEYDAEDVAHIPVMHTLSFGTSTVWLNVERRRYYRTFFDVDVRFHVEFANSEDCTRFLHYDMRELEDRVIYPNSSDVGVIDVIIRALDPIHVDYYSAEMNAVRRGIPSSQFLDEYPQPETVLIRHRDSNRGHDRPCYLPCTLRLRGSPPRQFLTRIHGVTVDWGAINNCPTRPLPSDAFNSLNSLHLNFPSSTQHNCPNHDPPSQNNTDALSFTLEATGIHGLTATNSVAQGNSITIKSEHRNVQVNLAGLHGVSVSINFISGDNFSGAISSSNIGGTNNVNTLRISSPVGSRSPRLASSLPRRHSPLLTEQAESQGGVGPWRQQRSPCPGPY